MRIRPVQLRVAIRRCFETPLTPTPGLRGLRLHEQRRDLRVLGLYPSFDALDAGLDLRSGHTVFELGAECGNHLIGAEMDGDYPIRSLHRRVGGGNGQYGTFELSRWVPADQQA